MTRGYFDGLYSQSRDFIVGLQLPKKPMTLVDIKDELQPRLRDCASAVLPGFQALRTSVDGALSHGDATGPVSAVGLNTVGFLCDRLTVLAMKEWVLAHRLSSSSKALELRNSQVVELLDALASAQPGHSSIALKVTSLEAQADAASWEEAYIGLLSINVLLWEAQEVLYAGKLQDLECEEMRRYIMTFSEGNIRRNNFIAKCEALYWDDFQRGASSASC